MKIHPAYWRSDRIMDLLLRRRDAKQKAFDKRVNELHQLLADPNATRIAIELARGQVKARWTALEQVYTEADNLY